MMIGIATCEMSPGQDERLPHLESAMSTLHSRDNAAPDPRLERVLRRMTATGVLLVLALPLARGDSTWLGALPLWLIGMPLSSWWALHRFHLPRLGLPAMQAIKPRRRATTQARRWKGARCPQRIARAA